MIVEHLSYLSNGDKVLVTSLQGLGATQRLPHCCILGQENISVTVKPVYHLEHKKLENLNVVFSVINEIKPIFSSYFLKGDHIKLRTQL